MSTSKAAKKTRGRGRPNPPDRSKTLFGKKLGVLLDGKKRAEKSAIMGVSGESVRSYLAGETVPDVRALTLLAEKTGVDLNWLLDDSADIPENGLPVLRDPRASPATDMMETGKLLQENAALRQKLEMLEDLLVEMKQERDAARAEAQTAMRLRDNEAAGA